MNEPQINFISTNEQLLIKKIAFGNKEKSNSNERRRSLKNNQLNQKNQTELPNIGLKKNINEENRQPQKRISQQFQNVIRKVLFINREENEQNRQKKTKQIDSNQTQISPPKKFPKTQKKYRKKESKSPKALSRIGSPRNLTPQRETKYSRQINNLNNQSPTEMFELETVIEEFSLIFREAINEEVNFNNELLFSQAYKEYTGTFNISYINSLNRNYVICTNQELEKIFKRIFELFSKNCSRQPLIDGKVTYRQIAEYTLKYFNAFVNKVALQISDLQSIIDKQQDKIDKLLSQTMSYEIDLKKMMENNKKEKSLAEQQIEEFKQENNKLLELKNQNIDLLKNKIQFINKSIKENGVLENTIKDLKESLHEKSQQQIQQVIQYQMENINEKECKNCEFQKFQCKLQQQQVNNCNLRINELKLKLETLENEFQQKTVVNERQFEICQSLINKSTNYAHKKIITNQDMNNIYTALEQSFNCLSGQKEYMNLVKQTELMPNQNKIEFFIKKVQEGIFSHKMKQLNKQNENNNNNQNKKDEYNGDDEQEEYEKQRKRSKTITDLIGNKEQRNHLSINSYVYRSMNQHKVSSNVLSTKQTLPILSPKASTPRSNSPNSTKLNFSKFSSILQHSDMINIQSSENTPKASQGGKKIQLPSIIHRNKANSPSKISDQQSTINLLDQIPDNLQNSNFPIDSTTQFSDIEYQVEKPSTLDQIIPFKNLQIQN